MIHQVTKEELEKIGFNVWESPTPITLINIKEYRSKPLILKSLDELQTKFEYVFKTKSPFYVYLQEPINIDLFIHDDVDGVDEEGEEWKKPAITQDNKEYLDEFDKIMSFNNMDKYYKKYYFLRVFFNN